LFIYSLLRVIVFVTACPTGQVQAASRNDRHVWRTIPLWRTTLPSSLPQLRWWLRRRLLVSQRERNVVSREYYWCFYVCT